jgi:hypothetical protein
LFALEDELEHCFEQTLELEDKIDLNGALGVDDPTATFESCLETADVMNYSKADHVSWLT